MAFNGSDSMTMYTTQSFLALSTQNPGATAGNAFISASTEYAKATTIENYLSNKVDQTDPLMSRATMLLIERIVQTGVMPAILLFGVTFNVINIAVFLRQGLQDRVTLCLFFLAVSDTCYMLSLMSFRGYSIVELFDKEFGEYWKARMVFMVGIYHVFADSSDCITMLIAVERCVCVLLPLKVKTWLSIAKIRAYIAVVVIACVPTNLIFCFKYNVISFPDPVTNATRYKTGMTEFMIHYPFLPRMHEIVNIVVPVAAFAVVIASTILISVRMRNVLSWRQNTSNRSVTAQKERREAAVTRMLTVICIIFTVCLIPYVLSAFFRLSVPDYNPEGKYSNTLWATTGIMHLFLCINASINFLVYLTMSSKFKATLWHMCGRSRPEGADELSGKSVSEAGTVAAASISTMSDKL